MSAGCRPCAWAPTLSLLAILSSKRGESRKATCCLCALWEAARAAALRTALRALAAHGRLQLARGLLTGRSPGLGVLVVALHVLCIALAALPPLKIMLLAVLLAMLLAVLLLQHCLALLQQLLQVLSAVQLCAGLRLLLLFLRLLLARQHARRGRLLRHGPVRGFGLLLQGADG